MASQHSSHLISQDVFKRALVKLAGDANVVDRLVWWSQHAHSSERWLQFELAYRLEQELSLHHAVGCERGFVDIVMYDGADLPDPFWTRQPVAGIELKWYANWWFKDRASGLVKDKAKTDRYNFPALALGVWLFAEPARNCSSRYRWINRAIAKGHGVRSADVVRATLHPTLGSPDVDIQASCVAPAEFAQMFLLAIGYFNNAARVP
jgi:hypothetical protein